MSFGDVFSGLSNIASSALTGLFQSRANKKNARLQRQFAQNSIQWRVADAERAGVHPIYALGAPTMSASPSYAGTDFSGLASAGQDIGRAIKATSSQATRDQNYINRVNAMTLENMDLQNEMLKSQIAKERGQLGPPMPIIPGGTPTSTRMFGYNVKPDPRFSDADQITQRYGEPAEWLYSPLVMGADAWKNIQHGLSGVETPSQFKDAFRAMQNGIKAYMKMFGF